MARAYCLRGAEVIVYPTAIGSEPDHPDFDTAPLWRQVIVANGIANGTFMIVPNRIGAERLPGSDTEITFYGSSFISDPYGRVLVSAPRDEPAVLVADLDLDQRRDWLELFPFLTTRRPDTYDPLLGGPDMTDSPPPLGRAGIWIHHFDVLDAGRVPGARGRGRGAGLGRDLVPGDPRP